MQLEEAKEFARLTRSRTPAEPTSAPPGSQAKIAVLEWRYAHGYLLWHPDDLVFSSPSYLKTRSYSGRFDMNALKIARRRG